MITKKDEAIFKEYATIEGQIALLEGKKSALKEKILGKLEKAGVDTFKETYGTFSRVIRRDWEYSDSYTQREEQYNVILKGIREQEQNDGVAKFEEKIGLSYRAYVPKE